MPKCIELLPCDWLISNLCYQAIEQVYLIKWMVSGVCMYICVYIYIYIYIYIYTYTLKYKILTCILSEIFQHFLMMSDKIFYFITSFLFYLF